MMEKVQYDISLIQGEDLVEQYQILHEDTGEPFRLKSLYELSAVYASADKKICGKMILTWDDLGWVTMKIPRSQSKLMKVQEYNWNLEMRDIATDIESDPIYGILTVIVGARA